MKHHQFLLLAALILFAPYNNPYVGLILGFICLTLAVIASRKE